MAKLNNSQRYFIKKSIKELNEMIKEENIDMYWIEIEAQRIADTIKKWRK